MRRRIIAGNWKMNKTVSETRDFVNGLKPLAADAECEVVLCVPFTDVAIAAETAKGTNIHVGAQNVAWAESGAFTGEISASMLKDVGAEFVIIGHSERRAMFGDTDATVNKRLKTALGAGLKPIVCIGETLDEREGGKTEEVLARQVKGFAEGLTKEDMEKVVVAYEPVWA
ncbi:MAG: triose-phosphate isomerase, partial [Clostridia bacterium]|nr:triose-phosphate isomerase [Clostridia bacterium]